MVKKTSKEEKNSPEKRKETEDKQIEDYLEHLRMIRRKKRNKDKKAFRILNDRNCKLVTAFFGICLVRFILLF